jgi:hypothetical protein
MLCCLSARPPRKSSRRALSLVDMHAHTRCSVDRQAPAAGDSRAPGGGPARGAQQGRAAAAPAAAAGSARGRRREGGGRPARRARRRPRRCDGAARPRCRALPAHLPCQPWRCRVAKRGLPRQWLRTRSASRQPSWRPGRRLVRPAACERAHAGGRRAQPRAAQASWPARRPPRSGCARTRAGPRPRCASRRRRRRPSRSGWLPRAPSPRFGPLEPLQLRAAAPDALAARLQAGGAAVRQAGGRGGGGGCDGGPAGQAGARGRAAGAPDACARPGLVRRGSDAARRRRTGSCCAKRGRPTRSTAPPWMTCAASWRRWCPRQGPLICGGSCIYDARPAVPCRASTWAAPRRRQTRRPRPGRPPACRRLLRHRRPATHRCRLTHAGAPAKGRPRLPRSARPLAEPPRPRRSSACSRGRRRRLRARSPPAAAHQRMRRQALPATRPPSSTLHLRAAAPSSPGSPRLLQQPRAGRLAARPPR